MVRLPLSIPDSAVAICINYRQGYEWLDANSVVANIERTGQRGDMESGGAMGVAGVQTLLAKLD